MKTTFNGRRLLMEDDIKIWKIEYLSGHWSALRQILNRSSWTQTKGFNEDGLHWKTTSNRRGPQSMKIQISQQPLIESSSNFKHKLMGPIQSQKKISMKATFNGIQPLKEVDLKLWKFEYPYGHLKLYYSFSFIFFLAWLLNVHKSFY